MQYVQNLTTNSVEIVNLGSAVLPPGYSGWFDGSTNTFLLAGSNSVVGSGSVFARVVVAPSGVYSQSLDWVYIVPLTLFFVWFFYKVTWRLLAAIGGQAKPVISD